VPREQVEPGFPGRLLEGYRSFRDGRLPHERERYERLAAAGQKPEIMVISCCDSRAAPETIFDAAPGEMFVLRNVANLVPPYAPDGEYHGTSAALEFAVQVLKVRHIVVMGHGRCGGVRAFREQQEGLSAEPLSPGDFIGKWMSLLEPATRDIRCEDVEVETARQRALEEASVRQGIRNLATFPCVNILLQKGRIQIHGAWFDIGSGELWNMNPDTGNFSPALPLKGSKS
jgi:carbonic anhydrase